MKILLLITLCLISGPGGHSDVIGYSGGRVMILSELQWDVDNAISVFKMGQKHWEYIIHKSLNRSYVHTERFMLFRNAEGFLRVLITNLKLGDTGTYRISAGNYSSYDVNLDVRNGYGEPRTMTTNRGQSISIICNYPLDFEEFSKYVYKEDSDYLVKDIRAIVGNNQKRRFFISYNKSSEVLSLNISDVRDGDGGVYLCGVMNRNQPVLYYSFFSETRLHIAGSDPVITGVSVSVSVALLLFGGFALILYILVYKRTQDSAWSPKKRLIDNIQIYENDLANVYLYENTVIKLNCQNLGSFTRQSDPTYQRLDSLTNQSDSSYVSLTNTADESHSHYQCLDPRTRANSIYHTLQC